MIITYNPKRLDWNERLAEAWASRPPGEHGTIIAIPKGGRIHREILKHKLLKKKVFVRQHGRLPKKLAKPKRQLTIKSERDCQKFPK